MLPLNYLGLEYRPAKEISKVILLKFARAFVCLEELNDISKGRVLNMQVRNPPNFLYCFDYYLTVMNDYICIIVCMRACNYHAMTKTTSIKNKTQAQKVLTPTINYWKEDKSAGPGSES